MPVETGYKPTPSEWKEGDQYKKWTNKPENLDKPAGSKDKTTETMSAKQAAKSAEEGLKSETKTTSFSEKTKTTETKESSLVSQIENDLIQERKKLTGGENAYPESYQGMIKDHIKFLEKALAREKAKKTELPPEVKEKNANIKAIESLLVRKDLGPKDRAYLEKQLANEKAKTQEAKEIFIDGEISPETKKKEEIISEVALMAVNPQDNKNMLENNHVMNYTKYELENMLNEEPNPEKRAQKMKEYLVNSLDHAITLRNEAKYGTGVVGKIKKFLNQGWGGALAKTAAGAGLIAGGLFSGVGIFSPIIYGAGLRMASEGVTHLAQEINNKFNKTSRENLLKQGKTQLEQQVNAKIAELMKNPELSSSEKMTQAILEFVDKTYAREVQTLVEEDSTHLEKAEKMRRYAGWFGGIGGMLFGMPMDIDADGMSHFVKFMGNKWYQGDLARNLGSHLWTNGSLANILGFGAGSMVTYALNRGAEGDERKYKFNIRTTKEQSEKLNKYLTNQESVLKQEKNIGDFRAGPNSKQENTEADIKRQKEALRKESAEKQAETTKIKGILKAPELNIIKSDKPAQELAQIYSNPKTETQKQLALVKLIADHKEEISTNVNNERLKTEISEVKALVPKIEDKNLQQKLSSEIAKAEKNLNIPGVYASKQEISNAFSNWIKVGDNEFKLGNDGKMRVKKAGVQGIPGTYISQQELNQNFSEWNKIGDKEFRIGNDGRWRVREVANEAETNTENKDVDTQRLFNQMKQTQKVLHPDNENYQKALDKYGKEKVSADLDELRKLFPNKGDIQVKMENIEQNPDKVKQLINKYKEFFVKTN